ncbi:hypothetical protein CMV_003665 [Castanea mollissima]|uniref:Uncharacterized protein n=1 Tax=Castanea mollissima TaxID=60419 RepID=A0A8J4VUY4_9ROSI|nr:hypothetical protein CMV_003665 [Castanea mollissima]
MGGALQKLAAGSEEKAKEINEIIEKCYDAHFTGTAEQMSYVKFFRAVCETVEDINKKLGNTQFRVPKDTTLNLAYNKHFKPKGKLDKDEFQDMLKEVIFDTGVTGIGGAKDLILYIFGVPITAFFIKQSVMPRVIPNEVFIPSITSATVFFLAKLNKI